MWCLWLGCLSWQFSVGDWKRLVRLGAGRQWLEVSCGWLLAGAVNPSGKDGKDTRWMVKAQLSVCLADESGSQDWLCKGLLLELNPEPLVQHIYFVI